MLLLLLLMVMVRSTGGLVAASGRTGLDLGVLLPALLRGRVGQYHNVGAERRRPYWQRHVLMLLLVMMYMLLLLLLLLLLKHERVGERGRMLTAGVHV